MKTPKNYSKNLENRIITKEMLSDCLVSVNKRAKNHRDKQIEMMQYRKSYRHFHDKYHTESEAREKKKEYYEMKETLLSVLQPTYIHKERYEYEKVRLYEFDEGYMERKEDNHYSASGFDYNPEKRKHGKYIEYYDKNKPKYHYYLFYNLGTNNTFHSPIKEEQIDEYDLEVVEINRLKTRGKDINDLISVPFVKKVLRLIRSGNYILDLS